MKYDRSITATVRIYYASSQILSRWIVDRRACNTLSINKSMATWDWKVKTWLLFTITGRKELESRCVAVHVAQSYLLTKTETETEIETESPC